MPTVIPKNAAPFTPSEIAEITGGELLRDGGESIGVSTDSRDISEGCAFVALRGERFDGHDFLEAAIEKGAKTLIVDKRDGLPKKGAAILVSDTKVALGELGRAHRRRWASTAHPSGVRSLVAITGSAGKTTTKKAIAALLEAVAPGEVHASAGNLNNEVGLPMTLLGLGPEHRFAVVELGTSARGEIERLSKIASPDVGVITLIAKAHVEGIGGLREVALEKGDLFATLGNDAAAIANADDPRVMAELQRTHARELISYGVERRATYRILSRKPVGFTGSRIRLERPERIPIGKKRGTVEFEFPLIGKPGALAAAAAVATVETLLSITFASERIETALSALGASADGRLSTIELADGTVILDDSYNANPASMESSISTAAELAKENKRRLVLILGEMRELGAESEAEHIAIGRLAAKSGAASVIAVSGEAARIAERARHASIAAEFVPNAHDAALLATSSVQAGDIVLVKGSRGVALEEVVRALRRPTGQKGGAP